MVFFHPCRDVLQAAWDPCSYPWINWSKREIELCVICIAMVWETMCLYDGTQWCSVCGEEEGSKNRSLSNPRDPLMFCGYLPSPGHLERPAIEIGFKVLIPQIVVQCELAYDSWQCCSSAQAPPMIVDWHWCFILDPPWVSCKQSAIVSKLEQE